MKAVCVIKATGYETFNECESVAQALDLGKTLAMNAARKGQQDVVLEVYEIVATAPVTTTHTINIQKVVKP